MEQKKPITEEEAVAGLDALFGPDPKRVESNTPKDLDKMTKKQLIDTIHVTVKQLSAIEESRNTKEERIINLVAENHKLWATQQRLVEVDNKPTRDMEMARKLEASRQEEIDRLKACLKLQDRQIEEWRIRYRVILAALHDILGGDP